MLKVDNGGDRALVDPLGLHKLLSLLTDLPEADLSIGSTSEDLLTIDAGSQATYSTWRQRGRIVPLVGVFDDPKQLA